MESLSIITQNLNRNFTYKTISAYLKKYDADIYAFQELLHNRCGITDIIGNQEKPKYEIYYSGNSFEENLTEKLFPWIEFKSGYFMERHIVFQKVKIVIINFHSSLRYSKELRCVLLQRLKELEKDNVILLGDFNAAFNHQTENKIDENDEFLNIVTNKKYCYIELNSKNEDASNPHYTFVKNNEFKKLDHIFVSESLFKRLENVAVEYFDEVNRNFKEYDKEGGISTDHSGIKLTFSVKN